MHDENIARERNQMFRFVARFPKTIALSMRERMYKDKLSVCVCAFPQNLKR